jgi:hypothetical protein
VPPTATPTALPTATPEEPVQSLDDLLQSIERGVERLRGIDTPPPVEHMFVDQAGMRERLAEEFADPEVLEEIALSSVLLKLLGVLPQDSDLIALYESLLGSQVVGLYDPEKEQFFVIGDDQAGGGSLGVEAQLTYAHEYVHRLQDFKFDLDGIADQEFDDDKSAAISALVEGDATTAQGEYMLQKFDFRELAELLESLLAQQEELPSAPYILQRSLEFPYVEGAEFVAGLVENGGFAAVDAGFENLPSSTEQILHPEKYLSSEEPIDVDVPDGAMGPGWSVQTENVMGEFGLKTWLEVIDSGAAGVALAGWGGDANAIFESDSGQSALGLVIVWDADSEASEFYDITAAALDANDEFSAFGGGLPGLLAAWEGPGGFLILNRQNSIEAGEAIVIAITPDAASSIALVASLVAGDKRRQSVEVPGPGRIVGFWRIAPNRREPQPSQAASALNYATAPASRPKYQRSACLRKRRLFAGLVGQRCAREPARERHICLHQSSCPSGAWG